MARIARKSDGRRIFTDAFKRDQIGRVWRGELTLSELSRKLGIARSLLQRWKRNLPRGADVAGAAPRGATPVTRLGVAQYIRELQLLVGKQTVELELLRAELAELKRGRRSTGASSR
jgi:transposase-like protein